MKGIRIKNDETVENFAKEYEFDSSVQSFIDQQEESIKPMFEAYKREVNNLFASAPRGTEEIVRKLKDQEERYGLSEFKTDLAASFEEFIHTYESGVKPIDGKVATEYVEAVKKAMSAESAAAESRKNLNNWLNSMARGMIQHFYGETQRIILDNTPGMFPVFGTYIN